MILCKIPVLLLSKSLDQGGGGRNIYIYMYPDDVLACSVMSGSL